MKYIIQGLCSILIGWPALIVGYLCHTIITAFESGCYYADKHQDATFDWYSKIMDRVKAGETKAPE